MHILFDYKLMIKTSQFLIAKVVYSLLNFFLRSTTVHSQGKHVFITYNHKYIKPLHKF